MRGTVRGTLGGTLGATLGVLKGYEHRGVATRGGPSVGVGVAGGVLLAATIRNVANPTNAWALNLRASSCECACSYDLDSSAGFTPDELAGRTGNGRQTKCFVVANASGKIWYSHPIEPISVGC